MNVKSNVIAGAEISWSRRVYWSLRRELWENRSIYVAPLAAATLLLFGLFIGTIALRANLLHVSVVDPTHKRELVDMPFFAAGLIMATTFVVGVIYSLDALYGERRDRSILFWKSLPVSDFTTVLSKAMVPVLIIPLVTFAIIVPTQLLMLLLNSIALSADGFSISTVWNQMSLFRTWLVMLYHLLTIHGLWYAPIFAYLLLISAWAKRAPFLWASLPLIVIYFVERIAFNTMYFVSMLESRISGGMEGDVFPSGGISMNALAHMTPIRFFLSWGLWIGLAATAVFLATAAYVRRDRAPL